MAGSLPADVFNDGDDRVLIQFPEYADLKYEKVIRIGTSVLAGQVEGVSNGALFGWCSILSLLDCPQPILQLQIDGRTSRTALEWLDRHDLKLITLQQRSGFSFSLPDEVFDGNIHSVSAHLDNGRSIGKFQYRRHTIGRVDGCPGNHVQGWIHDIGGALEQDGYELHLSSGAIYPIKANLPRDDVAQMFGHRDVGFSAKLPRRFDPVEESPTLRHRRIPNTILIGPEGFYDTHDHVRVAQKITTSLNSDQKLTAEETYWLKDLLKRDVAAHRRGVQSFMRPPLGTRKKPEPNIPIGKRPTAVIIPVFADLDATLACLQSVWEACEERIDIEVMVIDDCGPSQALRDLLPELCERFRFLLKTNPSNKGFVSTVNEAVEQFPEHHILILNSDTLVPPRFVERLKQHLVKNPGAASVTPFSNAATLMSWPIIDQDHPMPAAAEVKRLDSQFHITFPGRSEIIPTAVGFCMLLSRSAIDAIGMFDLIWGRGYCEENDWCQKATDAGFFHLAACDIFVGHKGASSFGQSRPKLLDTNLKELNRRYPDYDHTISRFLQRDPLAPIRAEIAIKELCNDPRSGVFFHSISLGGGIETYVRQKFEEVKQAGKMPLVFRKATVAEKSDFVIESDRFPPIKMRAIEIQMPLFNSLLKKCNDHVFNTFAAYTAEQIEIFSDFIDRTEFIVHDYSFHCPRVNLLSFNNRFCNTPEIDVCERCVNSLGAHSSLPHFSDDYGSVANWRAQNRNLLHNCRDIFAPSQDAADRTQRLIGRNATYLPHKKKLA
ncbi:MAG: glycosyltransferase family 2 protein, partial [Beijerinckiaceae bacterium]